MLDLTAAEQKHVRKALMFLRWRVGKWETLAKSLRYRPDSLEKIANGRRSVTAMLALHVARFLDVKFDDLINGASVPTGTCPFCGHPPEEQPATK